MTYNTVMTKDMTALATDIATIFTASASVTGTWTAEPDTNGNQHHPRIVRADPPVAMWLSHVAYTGRADRNRITIHIDWPTDPLTRERFVPYKADGTTEITVADTKTPAQIARDIERRLLPDVERHSAEQHQRLVANRKARNRREANMLRFAANVSGASYHGAPDWDKAGGAVHVTSGDFDKGYIRTAQFNSDSVDLDLRSLPVDLAIAVAQLVNGAKTGNREGSQS